VRKNLAVVILLMILLTPLSCVSPVSSESPESQDYSENVEGFQVTYGEYSPTDSILVDYAVEDPLNTTNPYARYPPGGPLSEIGLAEGSRPLYVLVFADEEERETIRFLPPSHFYTWKDWAIMQIERADEALVANFGIDIRILGFQFWDSDDSETSMYDLWFELWKEKGGYIGSWYIGKYWSGWVDAIIGITNQETPDTPDIFGLTRDPPNLDRGMHAILVRWTAYWRDDNVVQHEISHLFYAVDHWANCCAMAYHNHYPQYISEDGYTFKVSNGGTPCHLISYSYCEACHNIIETYSELFADCCRLVVRHEPLGYPYCYKGTASLPYGVHIYPSPTKVTISVETVNAGYEFDYWLINGEVKATSTSITFTVFGEFGKITVAACFRNPHESSPGPGGSFGCPTLFVWNGSCYEKEGILNIHADSDVTVLHEIQNKLVAENGLYKLQLRELDNYTSHIDYVKLYAVDAEGNWHECTLEGDGNVADRLRLYDGERLDLEPSETVDLKFSSDFQGEISYFLFEINGYNMKTEYP